MYGGALYVLSAGADNRAPAKKQLHIYTNAQIFNITHTHTHAHTTQLHQYE